VTGQPNETVLFAHRLRGIAALAVLLHHYTSFMFASPQAVEAVINMPPAIAPDDGLVTWLMLWQERLTPFLLDFKHWGIFGVALFFLVSGFVMPFAVMRTTRRGFVIGRLLRLWPTYVASFALVVVMLVLASFLSGRPLPFTWWDIGLHSTMLFDLFRDYQLDQVSWSLTIELFFYLFCVLAAPILRKGSLAGLVCAALVVAGVAMAVALLPAESLAIPFARLGRSAHYILFMLIGVAFNFHYRQCMTQRALLCVIALLLLLFGAFYTKAAWAIAVPDYGLVCFYALGVFSLCYTLRDRIKPSRGWDWLADISYPLYLLHAVTGYVLMNSLALAGVSPVLAMIAATLSVILFATLLHNGVERPSHALGRRWSRLVGRNAA